MGKIASLMCSCLICGESVPVPYTGELPICSECQSWLPWLHNQDLNVQFFCLNFAWFKDMGVYFSENRFGQIFAIVKDGKVVKTDLTTSLIYQEKQKS